MNYRDPALCDLLAAQYALGTLNGGARRRFEGLLPGRPDLRRRVLDWQRRLPELLGAAPAQDPPPELWPRLAQRLWPTVAPTAAAPAPGWFERLAFWRGWALATSLLAGVFALALLLGQQAEIPGYVVMVSSMKDRTPMWVVSAAPEMDKLYIKSIQPMDMPETASCLLWIRPSGSERVYPLGKLPWRGDERMLKVARELRPMLKGELLVTVEPTRNGMPEQPSVAPQYAGSWLPIKI